MSKTTHYLTEEREGRFPWSWTPEEDEAIRHNLEMNRIREQYEHEHPNTWKVTHDIEGTGNHDK